MKLIKLLPVVFGILLSFCLLAGCVTMGTETAEKHSRANAINNMAPKVSLFIHLQKAEGPNLSMQLTEIEIFDGEKWLALLEQPVWIESSAIGTGQQLLAMANLPSGTYSKIRFLVNNAILHAEKQNVIMNTIYQAEEQQLLPSLGLDANDSTSLFMSWDTRSSISSDNKEFQPKVLFSVQTPPITSELAYVSCPDINTIYLIRTDKNWITGSWGVSGAPTYLAAFKENDEILVLSRKENAIKIIELSSGRLKDTIKIPLVNQPLFMVADTDGSNVFILDQTSDYVYKINVGSGSLVSRERLDKKLSFLTYIDELQQVAVASSITQKVFILDATNLKLLQTLSVGSQPQGILSHENILYVAESGAGNVLAYNMNTAVSNRAQVRRGPQRIIVHDDSLFVSNRSSGSVSVLLADQLTPIKDIKVGGTPEILASSSRRNWLYVSDKQGEKISIVDLTSHKVTATIDLKSEPFDLKIIQ